MDSGIVSLYLNLAFFFFFFFIVSCTTMTSTTGECHSVSRILVKLHFGIKLLRRTLGRFHFLLTRLKGFPTWSYVIHGQDIDSS